ncbi:MAG: hypothetical protein NTY48_03665, partial [Candidatus Diapherotrites archaeon]|nr:hypothetical protein [Candidatus Diapherotrites archaeon]
AISENDTNATDANVILINRTSWRGSGNSWSLWTTTTSSNQNVWGWIILKDLSGIRLSSSGVGSAKIIKTQYSANSGNPGTQIPLSGSYTATITNGIGRINMRNLIDSNYMLAMDVNLGNDLQTQYSSFEVR